MKSVRTRRKRLFLLILVAVLLSAVWGAEASGHPPIVVTTTEDTTKSDGFCSLREAIISANKNNDSTGDCVSGTEGEVDLILIPAGTYTLAKSDNGKENSGSSGDLDIRESLIIRPESPEGSVTINVIFGFRDRIFHVINGEVTIHGITISGGGPRGDGGGIYNLADLTLEQVTLTSNVAGGSGGGIFNEGDLEVLDSTLNGNRAGGDGGAIANSGALTLANVTISGNLSNGHGGGLYNSAGTASLNNVTVAFNTADSDGKQGGDGGGLAQTAGRLTIGNTLVAANFDNSSATEPPDCFGTIESNGFNLIQNELGCVIDPTDNLFGDDPLLRSLNDYGGPTFTHALSGGSLAIDNGNPGVPVAGGPTCEPADQRGVLRPRGAACDIGAYEADPPVPPVLIRAFSVSDSNGNLSTTVDGLVPGFPSTTFTLKLFSGTSCGPLLTLGEPLETLFITSDPDGYFHEEQLPEIETGQIVAATVTSSTGDESAASLCIVAGLGNDSWPRALPLSPGGSPLSATHQQILDTFGQSLWYKFSVEPGSQLIVTLTGLPVNYDLTVYKDIAAAYDQLTGTEDLERLSAEFAPSAFSPSAFSPSAFSPSAFSPSAFSPSAFSPSAFSPSAFSPSAFSPSAFSPSAFSPSAFSPSAFSPSAFSPDAWSPSAFSPSAFSPSAFSPSAFSPSAFSPSAFSPSAFSAAQMQSLIGVSAFNGTAGEGLVLNSWNNTGNFYVRVRGREGAFSLDGQFNLGIVVHAGQCGTVDASLAQTNHVPAAGSFTTVILTDSSRIEGTVAEISSLMSKLDELAARSEVRGVVVDLASDSAISTANAQADANLRCPFAKNVVADAIRQVIDMYRSPSLKYVVLAGSDNVIPFFRHPDEALLGPEQQYVPPVLDASASQASLRLNYVLSQGDYGAKFSVSFGSDEIPIPDLAVGRLVETALEATNMIDAYLLTSGGTVPTPTSSLVTGYDFLQDASDAIQFEFASGLGGGAQTDTLITPGHIGPQGSTNPSDPLPWTADDLAGDFLGSRHDLIFLAGHFSASSALAADYQTSLTTLDLLASPVDMTNSIIFSAGCHSGYNIVNEDGVPFVTFEPDWAQAFAQKGATFIGGTGYQYGDTEFLEYSERIYFEFARQLRSGTGAVSVGEALVASKQIYLANTAQMRGIHAKAFLEATLFGLPMLSVDMPGARYIPPSQSPVIGSTTPATSNPGATLGLTTANLTVFTPNLVDHTVLLTNYDEDPNTTVEAFYLSGSDGVLTNPSEPTLPLELRNVSVSGTVLRGVGFTGGSYNDLQNILPLSGAPTTEIRGVHAPFVTSVFYPVRPWGVNYFDTLASSGNGVTQLAVTPAQFISVASDLEKGILRKFNIMNFRLYYSSFTDSDDESGQSALAAPPTIVSVRSTVNGLDAQFLAHVVDNPAAGIQEVWVTYTDISNPTGGTWQSIDLVQSSEDSTLWEGALLAGDPANTRFVVQAVNGLGLVTMATNLGSYYIPGAEFGLGEPTTLAIASGTPSSRKFGTQVSVSAALSDGTSGVSGKVVTFFLGSVGRVALTDSSGKATATLPILALPGENEIVAFYAGDAEHGPSGDSSPFTILKRDTQIALDDLGDPGGFSVDQILIEATLSEANSSGRTLPEQTIIFNVVGSGGSYFKAVITDYLGRAALGEIPLPPGNYSVDAFFSGSAHGHDFSHDDERYNPSTASFAVFTLTNTKPVGQSDAYNLDEDLPLTTIIDESLSVNEGVLANDTDVDDQSLTAVLDTPPSNGSLVLNSDGTFTYTPNLDFNGADSFTYLANDGIDNSDPVLVDLTIKPINDVPVANTDLTIDAYTTDEDTTLNIGAPGVLGNDGDADLADLPVLDEIAAVLDSLTSNVNLTLLGDGSFTYIPDSNYNGPDSFSYHVVDLAGAVSETVTVSITVNPINDAPNATDDTATTDEDVALVIDVLDNDNDVDGDPLSASVVAQPANGAVAANVDGTLTYTPNSNFFGSDSFKYVANDGTVNSSEATVAITIREINDLPVAIDDDSYSTLEDSLLNVAAPGVLGNDDDVEGDAVIIVVDDVNNGTLTLNADGSFDYLPETDFNGQDSFVYSLTDEANAPSNATVTIDVIPVNDPPVCSRITAEPLFMWPPSVKMVTVTLSGWTDPDGNETASLVITDVYQDEELTRKFDAQLSKPPDDTVKLRSDRDGEGNGRVYHIFYIVTDSGGATCGNALGDNPPTQIRIPVDHNESNIDAIDGGPVFNSIPE